MPIAHNLGFPPIGAGRELKRATEGYWGGKGSRDQLLRTGAELRAAHWRLQRDAGLDLVPVNDFSFYDRVLDTCAMVGAVPERYGWSGATVDLDTYFAMARGSQGKGRGGGGGRDVTAMEMTKWFDTNYHYLVPELEPGQTFRLASTKVADEFQEAKALGLSAKPVLVGPVSFLLLGKARGARVDRLELLDGLLAVYAEVLGRLAAAGATWVQLDERTLERKLDPELKGWLAFAKQKLGEVVVLARALRDGRRAAAAALKANARALASRRASSRIHNPAVQRRAAAVTEQDLRRAASYRERRPKQVRLPLYPTPTIGSVPQTAEVRAARRQFLDGKTTAAEYERFIQDQIERTLKIQEDLGLDVLVHGEFERNDMVEYFGEQLQGFAFTEHGWVQSYGSRYVKPPIIYGDVSRPKPMTVRWSTFAQSRTHRTVKGMLTGPGTILQWSFVRDDQPRSATALQLALAISDEVLDLERAGIHIIQIDEPALREGLPLRRADWRGYLDWAVNAFRLATSRVQDATQIHTHMCYSEFNDVIRVIERMDADVISIESARSGSELLEAFRGYKYPNEIGPGVYDIHSPRVPATEEIAAALERLREVLEDRQIWVNPDCGLKTRGWDETLASLRHVVEAARKLREAAAAPHPVAR